MKPSIHSKYSNENPPYLDKNWYYKDCRNTCVYNTFIKFGLPPKIVKIYEKVIL